MNTFERGIADKPVNELQWLFKRKEDNKGLFTNAELKEDPTLEKEWITQRWLCLTKHWGNSYEAYTPKRIDTWYEVSWEFSTIAIEKDKDAAIAKFNELADWLVAHGWEVSKDAGRI